ncbi:MAG: cytochrome P450, partial [Pseudomonadota bacterium]
MGETHGGETPHKTAVDPSDRAFGQNPYADYARLHEAGPAFRWPALDCTCFASFEAVDTLLRDRRFGREITHLVSRDALGWPPPPERLKPFLEFEAGAMLEREPPVHTRLRGVVNRAFVSRRIERLAPRIEALAHAQIDGIERSGNPEHDLIADYAAPILVTVIAEMLGAPIAMGEQLVDWSRRMTAMYRLNRTRADEDDAVAATEAFTDYIATQLDARQDKPTDDLMGVLLASEKEPGGLTRAETISSCILLLNAGHEATVHGLGNGVKTVLEWDGDAAKLFETDDQAAATVEEILRFETPLHLFMRYALEDVDVFGVQLRQGERIGLVLGAANRDPSRFRDPDRFDPYRNDNAHVSFGAGLHFCIGAPLARLELLFRPEADRHGCS